MLVYFQAIGPNRFKFHALISFCGKHFYKTSADSVRYKHLRRQHIDELPKLIFLILSLMTFAYSIVSGIPLYENLHGNIHVTPLGINLPFFEKDSPKEYSINIILQVIMCFYSLIGSFMIDVAACCINHAILLVPDLIRFNLLEFQDELKANGITAKARAQLRNTLVQLQDYNQFSIFFYEFILKKCVVSTFAFITKC